MSNILRSNKIILGGHIVGKLLKKTSFFILILTMCFVFFGNSHVFAEDVAADENNAMDIPIEASAIEDFEYISPTSIDYEKNITIGKGDSWSKKFKTGVLWGTDHDAVNIIITQVTGSYKVQLLKEGTLLGTSKDYTDSGMIWTWTNLDPSKEYVVKIINTKHDKTVELKVQVESYTE